MGKLMVLDLFSGIGGMSLGLERAGGFETTAFCEIEPYCRAVLAKHWPNVPCYGDIRELDGTTIECDVVSGGFPCQPFSVAGKQRGKGDDRHLWPEMLRVIEQARPTWVVGENVPGIIRMELDAVLSDLEGIGYTTRAFVIPACAVDAHHKRERVWIVAHADSSGAVVQGRDGDRNHEERHETPQVQERENILPRTELAGDVADANGERGRGRNHKRKDAVDVDSCSESERGSYFRWRPEPRVGRVAHGIPNRAHRLRALGNAVVPQIPEIIGRAIMRLT